MTVPWSMVMVWWLVVRQMRAAYSNRPWAAPVLLQQRGQQSGVIEQDVAGHDQDRFGQLPGRVLDADPARALFGNNLDARVYPCAPLLSQIGDLIAEVPGQQDDRDARVRQGRAQQGQDQFQ